MSLSVTSRVSEDTSLPTVDWLAIRRQAALLPLRPHPSYFLLQHRHPRRHHSPPLPSSSSAGTSRDSRQRRLQHCRPRSVRHSGQDAADHCPPHCRPRSVRHSGQDAADHCPPQCRPRSVRHSGQDEADHCPPHCRPRSVRHSGHDEADHCPPHCRPRSVRHSGQDEADHCPPHCRPRSVRHSGQDVADHCPPRCRSPSVSHSAQNVADHCPPHWRPRSVSHSGQSHADHCPVWRPRPVSHSAESVADHCPPHWRPRSVSHSGQAVADHCPTIGRRSYSVTDLSENRENDFANIRKVAVSCSMVRERYTEICTQDGRFADSCELREETEEILPRNDNGWHSAFDIQPENAEKQHRGKSGCDAACSSDNEHYDRSRLMRHSGGNTQLRGRSSSTRDLGESSRPCIESRCTYDCGERCGCDSGPRPACECGDSWRLSALPCWPHTRGHCWACGRGTCTERHRQTPASCHTGKENVDSGARHHHLAPAGCHVSSETVGSFPQCDGGALHASRPRQDSATWRRKHCSGGRLSPDFSRQNLEHHRHPQRHSRSSPWECSQNGTVPVHVTQTCAVSEPCRYYAPMPSTEEVTDGICSHGSPVVAASSGNPRLKTSCTVTTDTTRVFTTNSPSRDNHSNTTACNSSAIHRTPSHTNLSAGNRVSEATSSNNRILHADTGSSWRCESASGSGKGAVSSLWRQFDWMMDANTLRQRLEKADKRSRHTTADRTTPSLHTPHAPAPGGGTQRDTTAEQDRPPTSGPGNHYGHDVSADPTSSHGHDLLADSSRGHDVSADSSHGHDVSADSSHGHDVSADQTSSHGHDLLADSSHGHDVSADSSHGHDVSADPTSSHGHDLLADSSHGHDVSADSSHGHDVSADPTSSHGHDLLADSSHGHDVSADPTSNHIHDVSADLTYNDGHDMSADCSHGHDVSADSSHEHDMSADSSHDQTAQRSGTQPLAPMSRGPPRKRAHSATERKEPADIKTRKTTDKETHVQSMTPDMTHDVTPDVTHHTTPDMTPDVTPDPNSDIRSRAAACASNARATPETGAEPSDFPAGRVSKATADDGGESPGSSEGGGLGLSSRQRHAAVMADSYAVARLMLHASLQGRAARGPPTSQPPSGGDSNPPPPAGLLVAVKRRPVRPTPRYLCMQNARARSACTHHHAATPSALTHGSAVTSGERERQRADSGRETHSVPSEPQLPARGENHPPEPSPKPPEPNLQLPARGENHPPEPNLQLPAIGENHPPEPSPKLPVTE